MLTIKKYINRCGIHLPDTDTELPKFWVGFEKGEKPSILSLHLVGEHRLGLWYNNFAKSFDDPVLKDIFTKLAADELRHGNVYMQYLKRAVKRDPMVLRSTLMTILYMLRSSKDKPKHPTTITTPAVVDMLDDPEFLTKMIQKYMPNYSEERMKSVILANISQLAGEKLRSERELLAFIRTLPEPDKELVGSRPL